MGLALIVIIPIIVRSASSGADPTSAGERAGELSLAPLLAGLAVGMWAKLATRRWNWLDYGLRFVIWTVAFVGLHAVGRSLFPSTPPAPVPVVDVTESEKQGLRVVGGWVDHRAFAFILPVGDKFSPAPDIQDEINQQLAGLPGTFAWALEHDAGEGVVVVFVAKGLVNREREFRAMARGISRSTGKQAAQVLEDKLQWNRRAKEFRYAARLVSAAIKRDGWYPEIRAGMAQVGLAAAEPMKQTPMYQLYARIAPKRQDWPVLLTKIGELLTQEYDWSREVAGIKAPTLIVLADADAVTPAHGVEFFGLLGGGQRDAGWDGSGRATSQLAVLPGATHYDIFASPALVSAVVPFLDAPAPTAK